MNPIYASVHASLVHATRSVLRHRRRTGIAASAIAFGVVALILASAFIEWIFWATREGTIQQGLGHIHVARKGFHEHGMSDPGRFRLSGQSEVLAALLTSPRVRTVAPRIAYSGLISNGDVTLSFLGEAVDPEKEKNFGSVSIIVQGEELSPQDRTGIIVGQGLAANLGAKVGDTVVLLANTPSGSVNAIEVKVRGLFATVSKAYDDSAIRAPTFVAQTLLRVEGAHRWVVVLRDTADTPAALAELRSRFADHDLEFVPWYDLADFYNKTVQLLSRQMGFMHGIIGLLIVLTIANSMMMSVLERTSEIGTSMALGTPRRGILAQFVGEGLMLGLVGGLAGLFLGIGLAAVISAVGIPMPPPPGQTQSYRAGMIVTTPAVFHAFALAAVSALVAALYPAWKASRIGIVDALRHGR
jgi:putative ABC transport system permease protein